MDNIVVLIIILQITIFHKSKPRSYMMTPRRRKLCRPLARSSHCSLARKCLQDHHVKKHITKIMGVSLRKEIAALCPNVANFTEWRWEDVLDLMKQKAPTLLNLLQMCTKTKKHRHNQNAIVGVLVLTLCKHRRPSASILQRLVSLILYAGHASKIVSLYIALLLIPVLMLTCF